MKKQFHAIHLILPYIVFIAGLCFVQTCLSIIESFNPQFSTLSSAQVFSIILPYYFCGCAICNYFTGISAQCANQSESIALQLLIALTSSLMSVMIVLCSNENLQESGQWTMPSSVHITDNGLFFICGVIAFITAIWGERIEFIRQKSTMRCEKTVICKFLISLLPTLVYAGVLAGCLGAQVYVFELYPSDLSQILPFAVPPYLIGAYITGLITEESSRSQSFIFIIVLAIISTCLLYIVICSPSTLENLRLEGTASVTDYLSAAKDSVYLFILTLMAVILGGVAGYIKQY